MGLDYKDKDVVLKRTVQIIFLPFPPLRGTCLQGAFSSTKLWDWTFTWPWLFCCWLQLFTQ